MQRSGGNLATLEKKTEKEGVTVVLLYRCVIEGRAIAESNLNSKRDSN